MKDCVLSSVRSVIQLITGNLFRYDMDVANKVITEIWNQKLGASDALKYIDDRIAIDHAGCCFNWGGALAYRLHSMGKKVAILLTPEPPGKKVSVVYCADGKLYVADIVEYVKGTVKSIDEISAIPYEDFIKPFGNDVWMFDVEKIEGTYLGAIAPEFPQSNTTAEEFLRKE